MKAVSLALFTIVAANAMPAFAATDDTMYLDTALKDGWQYKGQSSVQFSRDVDGDSTEFSRLEVIVTKGKQFALCAIETNLGKNTASERPCATFE
jgi:hypothetical protein